MRGSQARVKRGVRADGWTVVEEEASADLKDNTPTLQVAAPLSATSHPPPMLHAAARSHSLGVVLTLHPAASLHLTLHPVIRFSFSLITACTVSLSLAHLVPCLTVILLLGLFSHFVTNSLCLSRLPS